VPRFTRLLDYAARRMPVVRKGSLAICDQALISGSNFAIGIVLARWLAPNQYGAYALTFSIFLLLSQVQQALLLEPQSVLGPAEFSSRLHEYLGALLWLCIGSAVLIAAVLGGLSGSVHLLEHSSGLPRALAGVAIAAPFILLYWLVRGACYVRLSSQTALLGSFIYCAVLGVAFFILHRAQSISPFTAYLLMGLGAVTASGFLLFRIRPSMRFQGGRFLWHVAKEHWIYGRWALASAVVTWLPWNVYYSVLGHYWGMDAAGDFRAIMNLLLPLGQTLTALSLLAHPLVAKRLAHRGSPGVLSLGPEIVGLYGVGAIIYWLVVLPIRGPLFRLLYGNHYANVTYLLPWIATASIFWFAAFAPPIVLRAIQSPASVFVVYGTASIVTLGVGIPAAAAYGIKGVCVGTLLSSITALGAGYLLIRARSREVSMQRATELTGFTG
jgi:O-antigen/teichoic acid export membrane protein